MAILRMEVGTWLEADEAKFRHKYQSCPVTVDEDDPLAPLSKESTSESLMNQLILFLSTVRMSYVPAPTELVMAVVCRVVLPPGCHPTVY